MNSHGSSFRSLVVVLSILGVAACGNEDPPAGAPNEPNEPEPVGSDPCLLRFDLDPLRWRAVGVGYEVARPIEFSNEGDETCLITLSVEGDGFATEPASTVSVEPDATRAIEVTWTPTTAGATLGKLFVTSGERSEAIVLEGEAVAGCLSFSPEVVDFGIAETGCGTVEKEVIIENGCSHPAVISSFAFESGDVDSPDNVFGMGARAAVGPLASRRTPIDLVYRPRAVGEHIETLLLTEENGFVASARLIGTGQKLWAETFDQFVQGGPVRTDLLFVVDDSPAMEPYTARLRSFGEEMATRFKAGHFRTRFAVTTTSRTSTAGCDGSGADGRLVPFDGSGPRWIDTDSSTPASDFGDLLDVGTCSQAPNEGFASALRAIADPLASQADDPLHPELNDGNLGFRRQDAGLAIYFVSASDDASTVPVTDIDTALDDAAGGRFWPFAIVAPAGGCEAAEAGTRYSELAGSGPYNANLCDSTTWTEFLDVGPGGYPISSRFHLSGQPLDADGNGDLAGEITVTVDSWVVEAVGTDDEVRWTYDAANNAVVFEPDFIPGDRSQIRIEYFFPYCR